MGLKTNMVPIADQIRVVDAIMKNLRVGGRAGNVIAAENYEVLKGVMVGLQARQGIAKADTIVEIERGLDAVKRSQTALGYDEGQMVALAQTIIRRWPTLQQALEQFEKEEA